MSRLAALVFTALAVVIVSPSQSDALKDVPGAGAAVPVPSAAVGDLAYKHASFNNTKFDTVQVMRWKKCSHAAGSSTPMLDIHPCMKCCGCCFLAAHHLHHLMSTLQVCWPWNTLIQPGKGYTIDIQAERSVLAALAWKVPSSPQYACTAAWKRCCTACMQC